MYYISFPGLGIEPFHIDKVAFSLFGRDIAWYGILITCGMVLAVLYALHLGKFEGISQDDMIDLAFVIIIFGVLGARLYYVIFKWDSYLVTDAPNLFRNIWETLKNVIAIWEGGLAIYGGILAGLLTAYLFARKRKIKFLKLFDILVPCVLIGQVIGRWGNFINIEAYGSETTLPWRMGILYSYTNTGIATGVWDMEKYVHPTFLYESLWNLAALVIVFCIYKKKKFDGQMFCSYLIWYGFGRMLIEGLRTDSLMLGNLRISQGVGFVSCILGIVLMVYFTKKAKAASRASVSDEEYTPVYTGLREPSDKPEEEKNSSENDNTTKTEEENGTHH
ncbi:MAG: prolipoprotein diacylglyceryl transferase [Eubacteriales bacterium]